MSNVQVRAIITAEDRASGVVQSFGNNVGRADSRLQSFGKSAQGALGGIVAVGATAGLTLSKLVDVALDSVDAANKNQAALLGLSSVSRAFGQSQDKANQAARSLASDGLMSVTESAIGLKNLLASGFSLDQAVTLMNRFKDSAAFGRQSALGFGQAVASATEGIKNGNSILVDNAGVTKNLSVILTEAGFSAQDLMKATTDASIRQALFNGILKETNPQLGDAARLAETFAGKQAMLSAQTMILQQQIGTALQPILVSLLQAILPVVQALSAWVEANPRLAATIVIAGGVFLGMIAILASLAAIVGVVVVAFGVAAAGIVAAVGIGIAAAAAFWVAVALNIDKIKAKFSSLPGHIQGALAGIGQLILGPFLGPLAVILGNIDKIKGALNGVSSGLNKATGGAIKIPGFAGGVENFGGGLAVVGEQGPELVNLPRGSSVYPTGTGPAGSSTTVNVTANVGIYAGTESEKRKIAKELFESLKDVAGSRNMSVSELLG